MSKTGISEINRLYLMQFKKTKLLYLDKDGNCLIKTEPAETEDAVTDQGSYWTEKELMRYVYEEGASGILYKNNEQIEIDKRSLPNAFYNNRLENLLTLAKEKKRSLKHGMPECGFIVPTKVKSDGLEVIYGAAEVKGQKYFLVFSTPSAYEQWGKDGYEPILINYDTLKRIVGKHGVIFNIKKQFVVTHSV